jgi:hypothetical protein
MQTWQAIKGFIAGEPKLTFNEEGKARLHVREPAVRARPCTWIASSS